MFTLANSYATGSKGQMLCAFTTITFCLWCLLPPAMAVAKISVCPMPWIVAKVASHPIVQWGQGCISWLSCLGYKEMVHEHVVPDGDGSAWWRWYFPALIANLRVHGVWTPKTDALFDVRVTDVDDPSYVGHPVAVVLTINDYYY